MPFTPIIFRTKNPEKSRLGKIRKNFGKNLRENVSGEEKAPNLVERGRGVLKYERIVWAKIVEINIPTIFLFFTSQFEIVKFRKGDDDKDLCVNGKCPYFRILIKRK